MKCTYTTKKGNITVEFDSPSPKDVFKKIGAFQSILEEEKCGCCGSTNISFSTRQVENGEYYEMRCENPECGAQLSYGQHKNNATLFVKRSDHPDTNGWFVYQGSGGGGGGQDQSGGQGRQQGNQQQPQQQRNPPPPSGGDIPF